jgi:glyoxylase-like metal-dependent hydrolase (beta-lactamase superfamily II)
VDARRPAQVLLAGRQADPDYPRTLTYPTETFASDAELRIAGLTLRTADFGPGESATATVYFEPASRALFGGDLTGNHVTPALIEANSCGWPMNLAALSGRFGDADTVYPGHGDPGPAAQQISEQRDYLKHYRELVRPGGGARFRRRANPDRSRNPVHRRRTRPRVSELPAGGVAA